MNYSERTEHTQTPIEILAARSYEIDKRQALARWLTIILAGVTAVIILFCLFGVARVKGTSMEPTLHQGDIVIVRKSTKDIETGDVIVYTASDGDYNVKRVVAIAGDKVHISDNGALFVNDVEVEETIYYPTYPMTAAAIEYPYIVAEGTVFVLGDHRTSSIDSRATGAVEIDSIVGKVLFSIEKAS